jgi:hypothetical protein
VQRFIKKYQFELGIDLVYNGSIHLLFIRKRSVMFFIPILAERHN